MNDVILIDAGTGNLRSVQKALETIGANVLRTDDPQKVLNGKKVIIPGVGAFGDFMLGLRERKLEESVKEIAQKRIPLLGICVGMQALFEIGEEMGEHKGLGILSGNVIPFPKMPELKIPHTGWNQLEVKDEARLFNQIENQSYVYFNHSYYCQPKNESDAIAQVNYGINYACAVQYENIYGVQFHPEKSQSVGLKILKNFLELT
ncbi:MAG TPA: imidazole glycerol phosphate synthase subunit HisH [Anaerolineae bacterium]|nr:imidazole glycerol phosphate synthase subunit HisH [Anaerolineae bacterium]HCK66135.1 imidazole glycerol phosphate synthase subunit HisH [Anaerolineae bacterium]